MVKSSKAAKSRVKRATQAERKAIQKSARVLADFELISPKRYDAIMRTSRNPGRSMLR